MVVCIDTPNPAYRCKSVATVFGGAGKFYGVDAARIIGAGDEIRTRDINLGKVALYQLSYSRTAISLT